MSNGQNLNDRLFFAVDNCKRKALQNEFAGSVLAARPASRGRSYQVYGSIRVGDEVDGGGLVPLPVPRYCGFEFCKCRWVNLERLNGHV
jgi:hypothetical protein